MTEQEQPPDDGPGQSLRQVHDPAKLVRVGTMIRALHQEARDLSLDENSLQRLGEIHEEAVRAVSETVDEEVRAELERLDPHLGESEPSQAEMLLAQAQLVGWLEGIFQGIQTGLSFQQAAVDQHHAALRSGQPSDGQDQRSSGNLYM